MNRYLSPHLRKLDAAVIQILTTAFDTAWRSVQNSGAMYPTPASVESARAELARYLIDEVALGERDPHQLSEGAISHLAGVPRVH